MSSPMDDEQDLEADAEEQKRQPKPRHGSLHANLIDQIGDVNLARRLGQDELDRIGMQVVREYEIDANSRKDWEDLAEASMKFTLQQTQQKDFPWQNASNVIFPLLSQAATEFGARAYPAVVQGNRVVKGVVWGSDRGTPMKDDEGNPIGGASAGPPGAQAAPPQWLVAPGEPARRFGVFVWASLVAEATANVLPFSQLGGVVAANRAAVLGGVAARAGGAPLMTSVVRVTFWGALAMAITAGVGALFGVAA